MTTAHKVLVPRSPMADADWIGFLEAVRADINPLLDRITLEALEDLGCIHGGVGEFQYSRLKADKPVWTGIPSDTRAISHFRDFGLLDKLGCERRQIAWGLTRNGRWVVMEIAIGLRDQNRPGTGEKALAVYAREVDLPTMLGLSTVSPMSVWQTILNAVSLWEARAIARAEDTRTRAAHFKELNSILLARMLG